MPKPRYQLKSDTIKNLLQALQDKTGVKLFAHSDAIQIAHLVHSTGLHISPHTISRLAGFFASNTKPYLYNVNTLAHFLGYRDVFDFEKRWLNGNEQLNQQALYESLSWVAFEQGNIDAFIESFTKLIPMSGPHMRIVQMLGVAFRQGHERYNPFLLALVHHENARFLFFHYFVDEDNNQNYFLHALEQIHGLSGVGLHEKIFCQEYAFNKYHEQASWGALSKKRYKHSFQGNLTAVHVESPHLMSRLFVNHLYSKYLHKRLPQAHLKESLNEAMGFILDTRYEPYRLAWTGRVVKAFLFLEAEDVMRECMPLKGEVIRVIKMEIFDFEFQSVLQFAAVHLGWIDTQSVSSFKRDWYSALLLSTAWDLMSFSYVYKGEVMYKRHLLQQASIIAQVTHHVLLQRLITRIS